MTSCRAVRFAGPDGAARGANGGARTAGARAGSKQACACSGLPGIVGGERGPVGLPFSRDAARVQDALGDVATVKGVVVGVGVLGGVGAVASGDFGSVRRAAMAWPEMRAA